LPAQAESQQNQIYAISNGDAAALRPGFVIGPKRTFFPGTRIMMTYTSCPPGGSHGPWHDVTGLYLGLKFIINGNVHYGWARFNVHLTSGIHTLTGYAYETIPNKAIIAGKTSGPADEKDEDNSGDASLTSPIPDTPHSASLGMLALGVQGVPLWRRKESIGTTQ
jgi:hypothetical protein